MLCRFLPFLPGQSPGIRILERTQPALVVGRKRCGPQFWIHQWKELLPERNKLAQHIHQESSKQINRTVVFQDPARIKTILLAPLLRALRRTVQLRPELSTQLSEASNQQEARWSYSDSSSNQKSPETSAPRIENYSIPTFNKRAKSILVLLI